MVACFSGCQEKHKHATAWSAHQCIPPSPGGGGLVRKIFHVWHMATCSRRIYSNKSVASLLITFCVRDRPKIESKCINLINEVNEREFYTLQLLKVWKLTRAWATRFKFSWMTENQCTWIFIMKVMTQTICFTGVLFSPINNRSSSGLRFGWTSINNRSSSGQRFGWTSISNRRSSGWRFGQALTRISRQRLTTLC